ncbi:hypothetical protein GQ44DRAFT_354212 [Phaeosphaeriaceae sp. PMI808]|nr:hypothetical protein GQ44DRAFT_354212 [Phaeosphaeriaceae sp. PMI808]
MCFYHERPWHDGSTCDEYDSLLRFGDPRYRETQVTIEEKTKGCPKCNVRIEKGSGCFHMTCSSCRHEFCWECLECWYLVAANHLNHGDGCFFRNSDLQPTGISGVNIQAALGQRR